MAGIGIGSKEGKEKEEEGRKGEGEEGLGV